MLSRLGKPIKLHSDANLDGTRVPHSSLASEAHSTPGSSWWPLEGASDLPFWAGLLMAWCPECGFSCTTGWGKDWERLRTKGEECSRGWIGWTASPIQQTWTRANSGRWWGTGRPGMLWSTWSQRVRHNWATEQQQRCWRCVCVIEVSWDRGTQGGTRSLSRRLLAPAVKLPLLPLGSRILLYIYYFWPVWYLGS